MEAEAGAAGDAHFSGFVAARYASLLRTAYLLTGDRGTAEDLVQSALMRAYPRWRRAAPPERPDRYVTRIMIRLVSRWRARRWNAEVATGWLPETPYDDRPAPLTDSVRAALMTLPMDQRAVVVLRFYEQLSETEIAELLGVRPGTVKSRCNRALAALRTQGLLGSDEQADREAPHV